MLQNFDVFKDEDNHCFQLRTKTNSYALEFDDQEKEAIFLQVLASIQKNPAISLKKLQNKLTDTYNQAKVIDVLRTLDNYDLLSLELAMDLKNQDSNLKKDPENNVNQRKISDYNLSIIGQGTCAEVLLKTAKTQTFKNSRLYTYHQLKEKSDIESVVQQSNFLIVDSNEWSPYHIESINKYALEHEKPWLYVPGTEGLSMKIGPLFYGKETGCYHCLISRIKSNHEHPSFIDSYEHYLKNNKRGSKPDCLPNADLVYHMLANLVLLEVMKFFEQWSLPITWKTCLSFDLSNFKMNTHTLLKKPFCEICKPELAYNPAPWLELITLK